MARYNANLGWAKKSSVVTSRSMSKLCYRNLVKTAAGNTVSRNNHTYYRGMRYRDSCTFHSEHFTRLLYMFTISYVFYII